MRNHFVESSEEETNDRIKRIRIKSNPNPRKEKVEEEIQEKNVIETPGDRFEDDTLLS